MSAIALTAVTRLPVVLPTKNKCKQNSSFSRLITPLAAHVTVVFVVLICSCCFIFTFIAILFMLLLVVAISIPDLPVFHCFYAAVLMTLWFHFVAQSILQLCFSSLHCICYSAGFFAISCIHNNRRFILLQQVVYCFCGDNLLTAILYIPYATLSRIVVLMAL